MEKWGLIFEGKFLPYVNLSKQVVLYHIFHIPGN